MRAPLARPALLAALTLVATSCAFPVEGRFAGSSVADRADPTRTIVLIYNHGFSRERAGTYEALVPPILQQALERNSDVVLFSQVRNTPRLGRTQHGDYIEAAIAQFRRRDGVPLENIILVGQSQSRRDGGRGVRVGVLRDPPPAVDRSGARAYPDARRRRRVDEPLISP